MGAEPSSTRPASDFPPDHLTDADPHSSQQAPEAANDKADSRARETCSTMLKTPTGTVQGTRQATTGAADRVGRLLSLAAQLWIALPNAVASAASLTASAGKAEPHNKSYARHTQLCNGTHDRSPAPLRGSSPERVGCPWHVRAMSSAEAPYSMASTHSPISSPVDSRAVQRL